MKREPNQSSNRPVEPRSIGRRVYRAPELRLLGSIEELTRGLGNSSVPDMGSFRDP